VQYRGRGDEQLYSEKLLARIANQRPTTRPRSFHSQHVRGVPGMPRLGSRYDFDPAKVITDWSKPLLDGDSVPFGVAG